jgi:uncharacterized protein with HEPN domain
MTDARVADTLTHMRGAVTLARSYVDGMSKAAFVADTRTQQAVIMNLVIIGELATQLIKDHAAFITAHPEIPWSSMRGMRNRIAHGYFEINLDVVWDTVQSALPMLDKDLANVLRGLEPRR